LPFLEQGVAYSSLDVGLGPGTGINKEGNALVAVG